MSPGAGWIIVLWTQYSIRGVALLGLLDTRDQAPCTRASMNFLFDLALQSWCRGWVSNPREVAPQRISSSTRSFHNLPQLSICMVR